MATADSHSVQSFAIIKNTGHENFVIGRFNTMRLACVQSPPPSPTDTPSPIFSEGKGRGSQWGVGFYGYRLKFWLFYGYRLYFSVTVNKNVKN